MVGDTACDTGNDILPVPRRDRSLIASGKSVNSRNPFEPHPENAVCGWFACHPPHRHREDGMGVGQVNASTPGRPVLQGECGCPVIQTACIAPVSGRDARLLGTECHFVHIHIVFILNLYRFVGIAFVREVPPENQCIIAVGQVAVPACYAVAFEGDSGQQVPFCVEKVLPEVVDISRQRIFGAATRIPVFHPDIVRTDGRFVAQRTA